jgi:hypothetical protein
VLAARAFRGGEPKLSVLADTATDDVAVARRLRDRDGAARGSGDEESEQQRAKRHGSVVVAAKTHRQGASRFRRAFVSISWLQSG